MTRAVGIIAGAAMILLFATLMIVVMPTIQMQAGAKVPEGLEPYSAAAARGREIYVGLGCVYCHSQQPRDPSLGPDALRGWGRPSVPGDYSYDSPHLLGTMRTGPDLLNIGARQPSSAWHLSHLYNPRALMPWSTMPSYPFLFSQVENPTEANVVVDLPPDYAPSTGAIVARQDALDLVQYLLELDRTYPVDEIPRADAEGSGP